MLNFLYDLVSQLFLGFIDGGLLAGLFFIASSLYGFILKRYRPLPKKFLEDGNKIKFTIYNYYKV